MTVLSKYQRLECAGIWRAGADEQRRNVFVALGDATIVIKDAADVALAHWSLPAVERVNPGQSPALFSPGADADETLELDDPDMIEAIGTVRRALARTRPHPGRLRAAALMAVLAAVAVFGALWLPDALVRHTATVLPDSVRQDIGRRLLRDLVPLTGQPCGAREGRRALTALQTRLFGTAPLQVLVVPGGPTDTAALPGGFLLLHRRVIATAETPEVPAGALLMGAAGADAMDPLAMLLHAAGPWATLRLLTRGEIDAQFLSDYAAGMLVTPWPEVPADAALARFRGAEVDAGPWLATIAPPPGAAPALAAAPTGATGAPVLSEADWQGLQGICLR